MDAFDVIVLGAGPGGYVAAIRAAQYGMKTAIIDKQWLGGVCLNVGCIPSKALLKNAEIAHTLRERGKDFGFSFENLSLDYGHAVMRSRHVSERLTKGVGFLLKKNNVNVIMGEGVFSSQNEIQVRVEDGNTRTLTAKNILIATGSSPVNLPGIEPDGRVVLSYKDAILQDRLPAKAVIIGGGAIGVEFATVWSGYGVDVTIVEMLPHILPQEDDEIAQELTRSFNRRGIKVLPNTRLEAINIKPGGADIRIRSLSGEEVLPADQVLLAIGFTPNSGDLGLEKVGVALSQRGHVIVDDRMATNVDGIWAIGDVTGKLMLAHVASSQALVCVDQLKGLTPRVLDYTMMPRCTYCSPQVASFGLTEKQAKENNMDIRVGKFPFQANGKALGLGESIGFVKLITSAGDGKLLGAHLIGTDVSELLPELTLAQSSHLGINAIAGNVHAHPTLSEAIMESAHALEGLPIHI